MSPWLKWMELPHDVGFWVAKLLWLPEWAEWFRPVYARVLAGCIWFIAIGVTMAAVATAVLS